MCELRRKLLRFLGLRLYLLVIDIILFIDLMSSCAIERTNPRKSCACTKRLSWMDIEC